MAVDAASLSTTKLSISFGLIEPRTFELLPPLEKSVVERDPEVIGIPSITYRGSLLELIDPIPRTRIEIPAPGAPSLETT